MVQNAGFDYEASNFLEFQQVLPRNQFQLQTDPPVSIFPLPVAHGKIDGAVIYLAEVCAKRIILGWDIDVPTATPPKGGLTNLEILKANLSKMKGAELYLLPANTFSAIGTGHTSYQAAREYIKLIGAKRVLLVHLSGHEDGDGRRGHGWTDSQWEKAVQRDGVGVARQGMLIKP